MSKKLVVPGRPEYEPLEFDKLAKFFERDTAESAHLKPYDGVLQDDGWDNDCN